MSKQKTETNPNEWTNIDFTNTAQYRTVMNFKKEGITWEVGEAPTGQSGGIPMHENTILKRLRKLDQILKPNKGPITNEIESMHRQVVGQRNSEGRLVPTEYITLNGRFKGFDFAGMEVGQAYAQGLAKKPVMGKIYRTQNRFDPKTGEDMGKIQLQKVENEYYIELPSGKDGAKRKKIIDDIIDNAQGTWRENILYYYKDMDAGVRDSTFDYQQFTSLSIEELRDTSKRGAGAKGPGYYWKDGKMFDRDGNPLR